MEHFKCGRTNTDSKVPRNEI